MLRGPTAVPIAAQPGALQADKEQFAPSANSATATAPTSMIFGSLSAKPRVMYSPSPPPAMNAAKVALAITSTAAMRTPVMMTG